jgi:hypothetical protein
MTKEITQWRKKKAHNFLNWAELVQISIILIRSNRTSMIWCNSLFILNITWFYNALIVNFISTLNLVPLLEGNTTLFCIIYTGVYYLHMRSYANISLSLSHTHTYIPGFLKSSVINKSYINAIIFDKHVCPM